MAFTSPTARNPSALLGGDQASSLNCQFTYYPSVGGSPITLNGSITTVNGVVANPGGSNQNQLLQKLYASSGSLGGSCPTSYTTSSDLGFLNGSQIVGTVTATDSTGTGLYELEPMVIAGGAVLILLALTITGIEWARRIIEGVTEDDGVQETWLEGWLHPNGRVATVVKHEVFQDGDLTRERVLGVWSLDQCERSCVTIEGTMDDMIVSEAY